MQTVEVEVTQVDPSYNCCGCPLAKEELLVMHIGGPHERYETVNLDLNRATSRRGLDFLPIL